MKNHSNAVNHAVRKVLKSRHRALANSGITMLHIAKVLANRHRKGAGTKAKILAGAANHLKNHPNSAKAARLLRAAAAR